MKKAYILLLFSFVLLVSSVSAISFNTIHSTAATYPGEDFILDVRWTDPVSSTKASVIACLDEECNLDSELLCHTELSRKKSQECVIRSSDDFPTTAGTIINLNLCNKDGVCLPNSIKVQVKSLLDKRPDPTIYDDFNNLDAWVTSGSPELFSDILSLNPGDSISKSFDIPTFRETSWQFSTLADGGPTSRTMEFVAKKDLLDYGFKVIVSPIEIRLESGSESVVTLVQAQEYHNYEVAISFDNELFLFVDGMPNPDPIPLGPTPDPDLKEGIILRALDESSKTDSVTIGFPGSSTSEFAEDISGSCHFIGGDFEIASALSESDFVSSELSSFQTCSNNNEKALFGSSSEATILFENINRPEGAVPHLEIDFFGKNNPTWSIYGSPIMEEESFLECGTFEQSASTDSTKVSCNVIGNNLYAKIKMNNPKGSVMNLIKNVRLTFNDSSVAPPTQDPFWDVQEDFVNLDLWEFAESTRTTANIINKNLRFKTDSSQGKIILKEEQLLDLENSMFELRLRQFKGSSTYVISSQSGEAFVFSVTPEQVQIIGPSSQDTFDYKGPFLKISADFKESTFLIKGTDSTNHLPVWTNLDLPTSIYIDPEESDALIEYLYIKGSDQSKIRFRLAGECTNEQFQTLSAISDSQVSDSSTLSEFNSWLCNESEDQFLLGTGNYLTWSFTNDEFIDKQVSVSAFVHVAEGATWKLDSSNDGEDFSSCNPKDLVTISEDQELSWVCDSDSQTLHLKLTNVDSPTSVINFVSSFEVSAESDVPQIIDDVDQNETDSNKTVDPGTPSPGSPGNRGSGGSSGGRVVTSTTTLENIKSDPVPDKDDDPIIEDDNPEVPEGTGNAVTDIVPLNTRTGIIATVFMVIIFLVAYFGIKTRNKPLDKKGSIFIVLGILLIASFSVSGSQLIPNILEDGVESNLLFLIDQENPLSCSVKKDGQLNPVKITGPFGIVTDSFNAGDDLDLEFTCVEPSGDISSEVFSVSVATPIASNDITISMITVPKSIVRRESDTIILNVENENEVSCKFTVNNDIVTSIVEDLHSIEVQAYEEAESLEFKALCFDESGSFAEESLTIPITEFEPTVIVLSEGINLISFPGINNPKASELPSEVTKVVRLRNGVFETFDQEHDFTLFVAQSFILEASEEVSIPYEEFSERKKFTFEFKKGELNSFSIPFDTDLKFSDLKSVIDEDFMINYYDKESSSFRSYVSSFTSDTSRLNQDFELGQGYLFIAKSGDIEFTVTKDGELLPRVEPFCADLNKDKKVDKQDLEILGGIFGLTSEDEGFIPAADLNDDGIINAYDLVKLGTLFETPYEDIEECNPRE